MALTPEQVDRLLEKVRRTRDVELTCPECQGRMDVYVQRVLDGAAPEGALALVREHLETCPGCRDEFGLILETLESIDE